MLLIAIYRNMYIKFVYHIYGYIQYKITHINCNVHLFLYYIDTDVDISISLRITKIYNEHLNKIINFIFLIPIIHIQYILKLDRCS